MLMTPGPLDRHPTLLVQKPHLQFSAHSPIGQLLATLICGCALLSSVPVLWLITVPQDVDGE